MLSREEVMRVKERYDLPELMEELNVGYEDLDLVDFFIVYEVELLEILDE